MNNNDIEKTVLGTILAYDGLYAKMKTKLSINLFTDPIHQIIFENIDNLWQKGKPIDMVLLSKEFGKIGKKELDKYCINLVLQTGSSAHIEYYIMLLVENYIKRDFVNKFTILTNMAKQEGQDIFDLRDTAFKFFDNLFIDKFIENNKETIPFPALIDQVEQKFKNINSEGITGIPSSLNIINRLMGGWQKSDLTIIAGRPGMGKTAFMVQQIVDIAKQNIPVGVFSLEMSAEQIAGRVLTNFTNIPNSSILRKGLKEDEAQRYWNLKDELIKLNIHIDDTAGISIQDLRMKAKMMKLKYNIKILFVDYLQLATCKDMKSREQEISKISQGLKNIAKELDMPVIALSQLSRKVEERADKRPMLSDLRDSGAIEQDADEVIFLYRPEYYGIQTWESYYNEEPTKNEVEIIVSKNRQGGLDTKRYKVNMATSQFMNLEY